MRHIFFTTLCFVFLIGISPAQSESTGTHSQQAFFKVLKNHCQQTFAGYSTFPTNDADPFLGKLLVAHIASCTDNEIRIPFAVADDRSRTWVIRLTEQGLQLKHDHRHEDGTADALTQYGGYAVTKGQSHLQSFAADAYTAELIPAAATNVWTIQLSEDGNILRYSLTRDSKPRFAAELHRRP